MAHVTSLIFVYWTFIQSSKVCVVTFSIVLVTITTVALESHVGVSESFPRVVLTLRAGPEADAQSLLQPSPWQLHNVNGYRKKFI